MNEKSFLSSFKTWKIWLAVAIGISFALYMLLNTLFETHFINVEKGTGTHSWIDYNKNNQVDCTLNQEFTPNLNGDYRKKTNGDFLSEISWSSTTILMLSLALIFMVFRDLAYMWRIKTLSKNVLTWKRSFFVIMIWEFASALAPGVASGSTVAMFILHKEKISLGKSTAIVIITTMLDNLYFVLLISVIFTFVSIENLFPSSDVLQNGIEVLFWSGFLFFLSLFLLLFFSIFFYPHFIRMLLGFIFRLPFLKKWRENAIQTGREVEIASKEFKKENFSFWIKSFLATFFSWTSRFLVINCVIAAFISLTFGDHFFILGKQFVLWLLMRVSPTPGGSGVAEFAFSELMSDYSQSFFLLAIMALIWRLISYFPYLLIGSILLPKWLKK
jgi:uncharacterized protein (TIRG00374 family)